MRPEKYSPRLGSRSRSFSDHKNMTLYDLVRWEDAIESAYKRLQSISEEHGSQTFREGGWTRKEILGHLIDSALNNHQRFVRAALDGSYEGPTYAQTGWVEMHGYASMP